MSDPNQPGVEPPHTNGVAELDEDEKNKIRPADIDADMREMERRKRVEMIMNSKLFREELERILDGQFKEGGGPSGLLQQISDMMGIPASRVAGNVFKSSNCVVPINDIRGVESMGYGKGEKILRCKLAAVFRLMDLYGWTQGINSQVTARINADQELFLVNPFGMLYHEVTASSLVKVDMQASIVEQGTTNFGVNIGGFMLHSAIHAARPDIRCVIHVHCAPVVAVSALKCGLLPVSRDSVLVGEAAQHQYLGGFGGAEERERLSRSLGPISKVLFLSNHGAVCCGETVEEAFYTVYHTVLACEAQLKLMPLGIDNLSLIPDEVRKAIYESSRRAPENAVETKHVKWRVGGVEYEALMRMLDNAGFRTGYIYRNPLVKGDVPRPKNDVEVPPAVSSLGYLLEEEELYRQGLWKKLDGRKGHDRTRWLNSPNVYQKVEILETGTPDPKKITKWVDSNAEEWVADGSPTHSSTPVRIESALQFVPKNTNPKEFKQVQQQIKDYRRADKISAGPQSHILEGVTWEEARRLQDAGESHTGDHVVLLGAASKGIIQRGFQHNATVYKAPYAKNPFDAVTDDELNEYKKTVERKAKGEYDTDFSESEALSSMHISSTRHEDITPTGIIKSPVMSPQSVASETEEESRDEPQILRIETRHAPKPSQPEVVLSDATTDFLAVERSQAARFTQKDGINEVLHEIQRPILKVPVKYVDLKGRGTEMCVCSSASLSSSQDSSALNRYKVQEQFSQNNIENYNPNIIVNGGTFSWQNHRFAKLFNPRKLFEQKDFYTTRYYSGFVPPRKFTTPYHFHIANLNSSSKLKSAQNQNNYFYNDFGKISAIVKSSSTSESKIVDKSMDTLASKTSSIIFLDRNTISSLDKDIQTDILKINLDTVDSETQTDILNYLSKKFMDAAIQTDIVNRKKTLERFKKIFTEQRTDDKDLAGYDYIASLFGDVNSSSNQLEAITRINEYSPMESSTENDINNEVEVLMNIELSSPGNTTHSESDHDSSIHSFNSADEFDKLVAKSVLNSILSDVVDELTQNDPFMDKNLIHNLTDKNEIPMELDTSDYFEDFIQNETIIVSGDSNRTSDEEISNIKMFDLYTKDDSEESKENSGFPEVCRTFKQMESNNNVLRDKGFSENIQSSKSDISSYPNKSTEDFSKDSLENFDNTIHYMDGESFNNYSLCDESGSGSADILNNAFTVLSEQSESMDISGSGDYHSFNEEYIDDDIFKVNVKDNEDIDAERSSPCENLYKKDIRSYLEPHVLYLQDEVTNFVDDLFEYVSSNMNDRHEKRPLSTIYEENTESMINISATSNAAVDPIVSSDSNYCTSSSSGYVDKSETSAIQNMNENDFNVESNITSEDEFSLLIYDEFLNIICYDLQKDTPKPSIYDSLKNQKPSAKSSEGVTAMNEYTASNVDQSSVSQIINQTVTFVTLDTTDESRVPETTVSSSVAEFEAYETVIDIIEQLEINLNQELDKHEQVFNPTSNSGTTDVINGLVDASFAELDKNIAGSLLSDINSNLDLSEINYKSCKFGTYKYIESEDEAKIISREIISDICKEQDKIFAKTLNQNLKRIKAKPHNKLALTGDLNKSKSLKDKKPVRRRLYSPRKSTQCTTKNTASNSAHNIDVSKSNVNTFLTQTSTSGTSAKLWVTFSPIVNDSPPNLDIDKLDNRSFKSPRNSPTWIPITINENKSPSKKLLNSYVKGDILPKTFQKDKSKLTYTSLLNNYKSQSTYSSEEFENFLKETTKFLEPLREEPNKVLTFSDCEDDDEGTHQLSEDSLSKDLSGTNSEKIKHQVELIEDYTKQIGAVATEMRENMECMIEEEGGHLQHDYSTDSVLSNVTNAEKSSYASCGDTFTLESCDLTSDSTNDSFDISEV